MMGHKICFYEEIWLIIPILTLLLLLNWSTEHLFPVTYQVNIILKLKESHCNEKVGWLVVLGLTAF